ncbi:MAG: hypothetical protein M5U17_11325 [Ignavibacterium sp.]|nr:hypothetical protein [Ignavibacterium sp.]
MKIYRLLLALILTFIAYPQVDTKIAIIIKDKYELIDAENHSGIIYLSLNDLLKIIDISSEFSEDKKIWMLNFLTSLLELLFRIHL